MKTKLLLVLLFIGISVIGQEKPATQADVQKIDTKINEVKNKVDTLKNNIENVKKNVQDEKINLSIIQSDVHVIQEKLSKKEERKRRKEEKQAKKEKDSIANAEKIIKERQALIKTNDEKLDILEKLIKKQQELVNETKGNSDLTKNVIDNLSNYINQRDSLATLNENLKNSDFKLSNEKTRKNKVDPKETRYTYLNGINFDFNNNNKTNYVGHFNIYVPAYDNKKTGKINKWGINAGVLKVDYLTRDSIFNYNTDKVLQHPLDIVANDGDKYNLQYNRYATQTKVSSISIYVQPMYRWGNQGAANFYIHGHLEMLATKYETITKITTLQTREITISSTNPAPPSNELIPLLPSQTSKTVNLESGYFGGGLTYDFNFKDNCILFLQGTIGMALNVANRYPTKDYDGNYTTTAYEKPQGFFLFRSYFQYNTSKATQVIIGTDIRGNLPNQPPYYSLYAGINLSLDQIFN